MRAQYTPSEQRSPGRRQLGPRLLGVLTAPCATSHGWRWDLATLFTRPTIRDVDSPSLKRFFNAHCERLGHRRHRRQVFDARPANALD